MLPLQFQYWLNSPSLLGGSVSSTMGHRLFCYYCRLKLLSLQLGAQALGNCLMIGCNVLSWNGLHPWRCPHPWSWRRPCVAVGTLGARCLFIDRVWRGRSVVTIGTFVSPAQCSMVFWKDLMDWSWAHTVYAGVFLSATVICCTTFITLYYGVTEGRVSLWCLNSMVSDTISVLVSLDTNFWQR